MFTLGDIPVFQPFSPFGDSEAAIPQAPTVAPVLSVEAELGSYVAELSWTASNQTGSPGFGYEVWADFDVGYGLVDTTTNLFYLFDATGFNGTWTFKIIPVNNAGDGPSSNEETIDLPPIPADAYLTPDESDYYLTPDESDYYAQPA